MTTDIDTNLLENEGNERRNPAGWVAIGALILIVMVLSGLGNSRQKPSRFDNFEEDQQSLKRVMSTQSLQQTLGTVASASSKTANETLEKTLDDPISSLVMQADKDPVAATLYAEMRTVQHQPVPINHLVALQKSTRPEDRAIFQLYSSPKLTVDEAKAIVAKLPKEPFLYRAAKAQALEKAGDKEAFSKYVSPYAVIGIGILMLFTWPFLGISFAVWIVFSRRYREGKLASKGIPLDPLTAHDADRLAIRAAQIFFGFFCLENIAAIVNLKFHLGLQELEVAACGGIATIFLVFALQKVPVDGKQIRLDFLGFKLEDLPQHLWLGLLGFLAEFPVALMLGAICTTALRWFPKASHPATEALTKNHSLATLLPVLIAGSIVAPFWEEIVFRGLLFPGLKRILGGILPGVLLSSFLFASVHGQGITLWIPLAFIGASSCFLSYQSRSLVPGIVMHSLHNTAIFVMILLT